MFLKMLSTRRTKFGTLRLGITYKVDHKNHANKETVDALLEGKNPAAVKVKDADIEKSSVEVQSLLPDPKAKTKPKTKKEATALKKVEGERDALLEKFDKLTEDSQKEISDLVAERDKAIEDYNTAVAASKDGLKELEKLQSEGLSLAAKITELEGKLADATAPAPDA
jgi:uncharacterized phage infection (PIP) family protein YhgE